MGEEAAAAVSRLLADVLTDAVEVTGDMCDEVRARHIIEVGIPIDPFELLDQDPDLGTSLIQNRLEFNRALTAAFRGRLAAADSAGDIGGDVWSPATVPSLDPDCGRFVAVAVPLAGFPLSRLDSLHAVREGLLVQATVLITAVGPQVPYIHCATFVCGHRNVHAVAFPEARRTPPPECALCGEQDERVPAREVRQYRLACCQLVNIDAAGWAPPKQIELLFTSDTSFELGMLGATCEITGYVCRAGGSQSVASPRLRVHGVRCANAHRVEYVGAPTVHSFDAAADYVDEAVLFGQLETMLTALTRHRSAHRSLAAYLLVSLAATSTDPSPRAVTVCVAGEDALADAVVAAAARCARFVRVHYSWNPLGPTVRRGDGVAEAGTILLSNGGVLRVPFLQQFKPRELALLADCVAERRVTVVTEDATELDPAGRRVETTLRVQPTVWASYDGSVKATAALKGIVAQFDLIYKIPESVDADDVGVVISGLLESDTDEWASQGVQGEERMDLEAIVGEAQELLPSMAISPEASHLLQGYYVMSRRIRGASASINRHSLETLCTMTAAIAALNSRQATHVLDAVYAVALFEESLTDLHGRSVLGLPPQRKLCRSALSLLSPLGDPAPLSTLYKHLRTSIAQFVD